MAFELFLSVLLSFPTNVFFIPFIIFFVIMLIDLIFDIFEGLLGELDIVDLDNMTNGSPILPPILTQVPLPIALCASLFVATATEYYLDTFLFSSLSDMLSIVVGAISLPIVAYIALYIASILLKPLSPFFNKEHALAKIDYIGLRAKVHSSQVSQEVGGEVMILHNGTEVVLNAVASGSQNIQYGDEVVIVSKDNESQRYFVAKA
ncbi:DUF1449 domain-containing protein [Vibrio sp. S9_S30]|uniref:DUF1449 domain-containing protein n=1 Tax=Vibrio sp. S9_S30 TaxID=2720226 RepID=UPI0016806A71|nr:DUF1449 domain-containing protein [Vibrio sp. S9_S30]MBD1555366.1 DUF1449 domain-containing protein [Vibrio sp. S9_S30]